MKGMKIIKLEYGSKRVARGAVSWSEEAATDEEGFLIGGEEESIVGKRAGWEMGLSGQKRDGTRAYLGKGGQELGKWTGFSHFETAFIHLFPHNSTQVVDCPHLSAVRLFGEALKSGKTMGTKMVRLGKRGRPTAGDKGKINHIYASRYIDFYACNSL